MQMTDANPLFIGIGVGLLLGGLLVGLWINGRLRPQTQRAEATAHEVRTQLEQERIAVLSLRQELSQTQQARVMAETRIEETTRQLIEQKAQPSRHGRNSWGRSKPSPAKH